MNHLEVAAVPDSNPTAARPMSSRGLRVCLVPYGDQNPYQRELVTQLKALRAEVTFRKSSRWLDGLWIDVLRGRAPEVLHLHWLPQFAFNRIGLRMLGVLVRLVLLRGMGLRMVWTAHNLYGHEAKWRAVDRWFTRGVIRCCSRVIVHSETAGRLVVKEFGLGSDRKIVVVPHGHYIGCYPNTISRQDARLRLGLDRDATVLLFLGNIRPYKGVGDLIAAFRELNAPGGVLVIAGKPADRATVAELEAMVAGDPRVQLRCEFVPDDEVQVYMNACDVVTFPYQDVLTSGAVVLAMSFGRACLAPAIGCIPDLLDEAGAWLYAPQQPGALRAVLERAIRGRERLAAMGAVNLQRARTWGWDRVARETLAVYAAALPRTVGDHPAGTA